MPNVTSVETCLLLFFTFWMGVQLPLTSCNTLGGMKVCSRNLMHLWDASCLQATLSTTPEWLGFNEETSHLGDNRNWITCHYLPSSSKSLMRALPSICEKSKTHDLFDSAARTAISALYAIFLARMNSHWMSDRMLLTWNVCLSKFTYIRVTTCLCHDFCMHYCTYYLSFLYSLPIKIMLSQYVPLFVLGQSLFWFSPFVQLILFHLHSTMTSWFTTPPVAMYTTTCSL